MIQARDKTLVYRTFPKINHSCNPNVENFVDGYNMIIVAIKPIRKGEEIFVTYYKSLRYLLKTEEIHKWIKDIWNLSCSCDIDKSRWRCLSEEALNICQSRESLDDERIDNIIAIVNYEHPILASVIAIKICRLYLEQGDTILAEKYRDVYTSIMGPFTYRYPNSEPQKVINILLNKDVEIILGDI